jgi:glutathione S-transferase
MPHLLYIGYKNYSSWSLRPWLCLRWAGIAFEERIVPLDRPGYGRQQIAEIKAVSPSGTVPALHVDASPEKLVIWDSLAIAEWAAERVEPGALWPSDSALRAQARAATCEMHSGFAAVRRDLPMNIRRRCESQPDWPEDTQRQLRRIVDLWTGLRERHAALGPFLFGQRSIADAFFAPMATRLRTYAAPVPALAQRYCDTVLADADFRAWEADCIADSWDASGYSVVDGRYR